MYRRKAGRLVLGLLRGGDKMKIAFIGSHSTGKTTLCNELIKDHQDHFLIPEIARVFGIEKIPMIKRSIELQKEMIQVQKKIEFYHDRFISDRSILDFGIYSMDETLIRECFRDMKGRYDYVFYVPITFKIVDDGFRNIDRQFQKDIDRLFQIWMPDYVYEIRLKSVKNRINEINEVIKW